MSSSPSLCPQLIPTFPFPLSAAKSHIPTFLPLPFICSKIPHSHLPLVPMAFSHPPNKLSSFWMVPSRSLNKHSSSITSKILKEEKLSDGLPGAFVTLLAGNGDDIMGVVCLAKGLRKVKSAYPLVVAVLPGVPESHLQRLESQGCILTKIKPVYSTQLGCSTINFSKLRLWDLDGYEKLVFLDSHLQVYGNIDELFDYPEEEHGDCGVLYAVLDCCCEKTSADNPQYNIYRCQEEPYFSDGMFVFEPSKKTFNYLVETLELIPPTPTPFAVQDYLNKFFKDVYKPISLIYNLNEPMLWNHPEHVVDFDRVKVIHYCAKIIDDTFGKDKFCYNNKKGAMWTEWGLNLARSPTRTTRSPWDPGSLPWNYTGREENMNREDIKLLVKKWWDVYNDESLDYKPSAQEEVYNDESFAA